MFKSMLSLALSLALVSPVLAGSDGEYQFTGVVTETSAKTFTVKKSEKETWTFFSDKVTAPAVGEKVTVYYRMLAQSVERKPAKGKKGK